jgi:hypothetical protein
LTPNLLTVPFATVADFIHYDRTYHRLQFYAESRIISLNDVVRMLFRDDETPPGIVEHGASITAGAGISRWRPVCGDFPTKRDADQFWTIWNRLDGVLPVPPPGRVLRVISGGRPDDS